MENSVKIPLPTPGENQSYMSRTIDGQWFDTRPDHWKIPAAGTPASVNFANMPGASQKLVRGIKAAFVSVISVVPPERLGRAISTFRTLIRFLCATTDRKEIDEIDIDDVLRFKESLSQRQRYKLRKLKEELTLWNSTGSYGLTANLREFLPNLQTDAHEVGAAVRNQDPKKGPLTDIEFETVVTAMHHEFGTGKLSNVDYTLLVLSISLGCRPTQLAMLKVKDLSSSQLSDGSNVHILQVTRLKQGKGIRPRTIFRPRKLSNEVGELVNTVREQAIHWAAVNNVVPDEAPLFPADNAKEKGVDLTVLGLAGHFTGKSLGEKIKRLFKDMAVVSHRTGKPLTLFQTRIRRTFGTRAAAEGHSAAVVADLMDHSWTKSSLVYVQSTPRMIERIDKALALRIAPMAQAFSGTLSNQGEVIDARTIHFAEDGALEVVGGCGKFSFCGLAAPLACYTCKFFRPWVDAPHEALIDQLEKEKLELLDLSDSRIASINDRTMLAIAEVVSMCRKVRAEGNR